MSSSKVNFGPEIKYSSDLNTHGSYRYSNLQPQATSTVQLSSTNIQESIIDLPNKVFNLSKSMLNFNLQVSQNEDGKHTCLHNVGLTMIDRVSLMTRDGAVLFDIPNFNSYSRAITPLVTPLEKYLTHDTSLGSNTRALAGLSDKGMNFHRSNTVSDDPASLNVNTAYPIGQRLNEAGLFVNGALDYTDYQYIKVVGDGAGLGAFNCDYNIPLSQFHHTIASVNRDLYFGQALQLRIYWAPLNKMGMSMDDNILTNPAVLTIGKVDEIRMLLAVENDPNVVDSLVQRVRSQGLEMNVPYVYGFQYSTPAGVQSTIQQRINSGHGHSLLNVYHVVYNTLSTNQFAYDIENVSAKKVKSFQTQIDNQNLTEIIVNCEKLEDYQLMQDLIHGSTIQSSKQYQANRVHVDSFRAGRCKDWKDMDSDIDGLSLEAERLWSIQQNTENKAFRQYTWMVVQRLMRIDPSGQVTMR